MKIELLPEQKNQSGIYQIKNLVNGKVYIGQTKCFIKRYASHKSSLTNNKHKNHHLQAAVNKYGIEQFVFEVLEICSLETLDQKETEFLIHNKNICYNHDLIPKKNSKENLNLSTAVKKSWESNYKRKRKAAEKLAEVRRKNPNLFDNSRKTRIFISPTGEVCVVENLKEFCKIHELSVDVMRGLAKGKYYAHKGWKSAEITKTKKPRGSRKNIYRFFSPTNEVILTNNIANLAREINVDRTGLFRLIKGRYNTYCGWKFLGKNF